MSKVYSRIDGKASLWERTSYNDRILRYVVKVGNDIVAECDNLADAYRAYNRAK